MKPIQYLTVCCLLAFLSCTEEKQPKFSNPVNWSARHANDSPLDSLEVGVTYLSVYSQIYTESDRRIHDLVATVSMKNIDREDTIFINRAQYYGKSGKLLRSYFDHSIYIAPLETVQIVIDQKDNEGGTGANFIFDWQKSPDANEPFFEAVMISTLGTQGLSFTTQGKRID